MLDTQEIAQGLSISRGPPLADEAGIGAITLGEYLREITARYGDAEAAVMYRGESAERWTYAELWNRAQAVARALVATPGMGKGSRVGLLMTNRLEFLSGFFGAALAGGIPAPISTFFTATELDEVLQASGCSVLLLERQVLKRDFAGLLLELEPELAASTAATLHSSRFPFLRRLALVDSDSGIGAIQGWQDFLNSGEGVAPGQIDAISRSMSPCDPATLFFSSGSTGRAKGILGSHRAACLQLWRWKQWYAIEKPPRTWSANGFFFSGNFCMALGGTLSSGGTLVLQRFFDAEEALNLMEQEKVTMPLAWPHQWAKLVAAGNCGSVDLSAMHYVHVSCPLAGHPTVNSHWKEPQQAYGSTEAFTLISVYPSGTPAEEAAGSHGLPTAGSIIKIVDPLSGEIVPLGESGEIAIKGPTLMLGYIGVPLEATLDEHGFFRTGDSGHIDREGRLFWKGRLNDIIKTGGANVSPLEIDEVIRNCPGVKLNQTVGVADELLGEVVVTCIVLHEGVSLIAAQIREFAREKLASFKVPREVLFFTEEDLKTTGSAKIKTAALRKLATERLTVARQRTATSKQYI